MSESKHEKWEVVVGGNFLHVWEYGRHDDCRYLDYENGMVCDVRHPSVYETGFTFDETIKQVMPRARLIAAAPDLYDALEAAMRWIGSLTDWEGAGDPDVDKWRATIAKAKGENHD